MMDKFTIKSNITSNKYARICCKCGITLNKENTGDLQWLQPECNKCTKLNNCIHRYAFDKKGKNIGCYYCGATE